MIRVLLAEDEEDLREITELMLSHSGCVVTAVADGLGALRSWVADGFDVVVLDHNMPRMTGLQAAAVLRERGYDGPLVLWTGWDRLLCPDERERLGVQVLPKHDAGELVSTVVGLAGGQAAYGSAN